MLDAVAQLAFSCCAHEGMETDLSVFRDVNAR